MEKKEKSKAPIIFLLIILIIICTSAGVYGYLNKDKNKDNNINNNIEEKKEEEVNDFEKVNVNNANIKLEKLDFSNKVSNQVTEEEWVVSKQVIYNGKVSISLTPDSKTTNYLTYTVDSINNAISVKSGFNPEGSGFVETYILTSDGKVYHIIDDLTKINSTNYVGKAEDMKVSNAESIAVVDENFNLNENAETTRPTVYIKTKDGRIFTDENLLNTYQNGLVEVINVESEENQQEIINIGFDKATISDLDSKLSKLNFENKTHDLKKEDDMIIVDANIENGIVSISIELKEEESYSVTYKVPNILNAVSVGAGISVQGTGSAEFYILTSDGKVYQIIDDFADIRSNSNYVGSPKDMLITNAISIAVVDQDFNLSDTAETTVPTVYIKTSDGRVFTNEILLEQKGLVEVINK